MKATNEQAIEVVLQVDGLHKEVLLQDGDKLKILQDISFSVGASETLAIVGASGSGKSTLLSLLAGLDLPSGGEVVLAGQRLFDLNEDQRASVRAAKVGFVFQAFHLLPALTAEENVMLPLELAGRRDAQVRAREWLARVGLDARLQHYPRHLSGGEQQRVALARAFAMQPALLLADEPTGNLDEQTGKQIIELLFALNRDAGTTLILVTHDKQLAQACGRQLHLQHGQLVMS